MSTAHAIALGLLIAIGLLSVVGCIRILLHPFNVAARVLYGAADAIAYNKQMERAYRKQIEAKVAIAEMRNALEKFRELK